MNFKGYFNIMLGRLGDEVGNPNIVSRFVNSYLGGGLYSPNTLPTTEHLEQEIIPAAVETDMEGLMYLIALSPPWMKITYRKFTHHPTLSSRTRKRLLDKWLSACTIMPYLPLDFPIKGARYAQVNVLQNSPLPLGTYLHVITQQRIGIDGYLAGFSEDKIILSQVPLHYQYIWLDLPRSLQEVPTEVVEVMTDTDKKTVTYIGRTNFESPKIVAHLSKSNKAQVSTGLTPHQHDLGEALLFWYNKNVLLNIRVKNALKVVGAHPNFMLFIKDTPPRYKTNRLQPQNASLCRHRFIYTRD